MENDNKIIPFKQKTRQKSEFRLKAEISIYICRDGKRYTCDCSSPNNITPEGIIEILEKILKRISKEITKIEIEKNDYYEITFTLLYYEDIKNRNNYKYLCLSQDIKLEKLAEYLYTFINIYKYKTSGGI